MAKKDTKAIQLLAGPEIYEVWEKWREEDEKAGTKGGAQEKLRAVVSLGLDLAEGRLIAVDPAKKRVYDAIETLLRAGIVADPFAPKVAESAPGTGKKPKLGVRDQFKEMRR